MTESIDGNLADDRIVEADHVVFCRVAAIGNQASVMNAMRFRPWFWSGRAEGGAEGTDQNEHEKRNRFFGGWVASHNRANGPVRVLQEPIEVTV